MEKVQKPSNSESYKSLVFGKEGLYQIIKKRISWNKYLYISRLLFVAYSIGVMFKTLIV
jgi:hypothetical protein